MSIFQTFASTQFEEAEAHLAASYCEHKLHPGINSGVAFAHRSTRLGEHAFNTLTYGAEIDIAARGFGDFYMVEMPIRGGVDIQIGRQEASSTSGHALCLSPGQELRSRWHRNTFQLMLQLSRRSVVETFERRAHRPMSGDIVFDPVVDLSTPHGQALSTTMRELALMAANGQPDSAPGFQLRLDTITDLLVANLPYFRDGSPVPDRLYATSGHVRRALAVMRQNYAQALNIAELSDQVGVSERALHDGFQRYYQKPPYEVLTRIRMEAARQLVRFGTEPLAEIARQVGMPHQGRFSAQYHKTFGILPRADRKASRP